MSQPEQPADMENRTFQLLETLKRDTAELESEYNRKYPALRDHIKELNKITDDLENMHKVTTIGSLSGTAVGAAGGITSIVGAALAPFTFGTSLIVAGVGVAVGLAGGVTGAAFSITDTIKQNNLRETIKKIISDYQSKLEPLVKLLDDISKTLKDIEVVVDQQSSVTVRETVRAVRGVKAASDIVRILYVAKIGKVAAKAADTVRLVGRISTVITGVFVILDIISIVNYSKELDERNKLGDNIEGGNIESETLKFIQQMRETCAAFQSTLDEIKSVIDTVNKKLQTNNEE